MLNVYETIRANPNFRKFEVGKLLFVEYTCPIEQEYIDVWTPSDYMLHVLTGKKTWKTPGSSWTAQKGQTFYIKKGAYVIEQSFEEEFCMLLFFISDDFIRETLKQVTAPPPAKNKSMQNDLVFEVENDPSLMAYFQSMYTYFLKQQKPTDELLVLKLRELLFTLLNGQTNRELRSHFWSLFENDRPSLESVMSRNFCYNLSLTEFAQLAGRSLSTFKRDFKKQFGQTPGSWLQKKRLDYASTLLSSTDLNVSQVAQESGFENLAHFSRVFKDTFGLSPSHYRRSAQ